MEFNQSVIRISATTSPKKFLYKYIYHHIYVVGFFLGDGFSKKKKIITGIQEKPVDILLRNKITFPCWFLRGHHRFRFYPEKYVLPATTITHCHQISFKTIRRFPWIGSEINGDASSTRITFWSLLKLKCSPPRAIGASHKVMNCVHTQGVWVAEQDNKHEHFLTEDLRVDNKFWL